MQRNYKKSPKKVYKVKRQRPELIMARYMTPMRSLPEVKTIDTSLTLVSGASNAFSTPVCINQTALTTPSGGLPAIDSRVGRKIFMTSMLLRLAFPLIPGRLIVVYDKQSNGTIPLTGAYLKSDNLLSLTNLANKERFIVLVDEMYPDPNAKGYGDTTNNTSGTVYRKIGLEALYQDVTIGNNVIPNTGSILIAHASLGAAVSTLSGSARIRFTDA